MNVLDQAAERVRMYTKAWFKKDVSIISTQSTTALSTIPDNSFDYVFIDPPFGANLMYSELNSLSEGWLKVFTQDEDEAIENRSQGKQLNDYRRLMSKCFAGKVFRVLKPGRWATMVLQHSGECVELHPDGSTRGRASCRKRIGT